MIKSLGSVENVKNIDFSNNQVKTSQNIQAASLPEMLRGNNSQKPDKNNAEKQQITPSELILLSSSILATAGLVVLFKGKIKSFFKPAKTVVKAASESSSKTNLDNFITKFVKQEDKTKEIMNKLYFSLWGKDGIPLKYKRKSFIADIRAVINDISPSQQASILQDFNLKFGVNDLDGIARISSKNSPIHKKINNLIDTFYNHNECLIKNAEGKDIIDCIRKAFPEFNMIIGKVQHDTHAYSVDIHTLKILQSILNNDSSGKILSEESKIVLYLSAIFHDFGKAGNIRHPGHELVSAREAEAILNRLSLSQNIKNRIINHVKNHHWFTWFNQKISNVPGADNQLAIDELLKIFTTDQDLNIAKILAKADLENVNPTFHRYILGKGHRISQEGFDKIFWTKVNFDIPNQNIKS